MRTLDEKIRGKKGRICEGSEGERSIMRGGRGRGEGSVTGWLGVSLGRMGAMTEKNMGCTDGDEGLIRRLPLQSR